MPLPLPPPPLQIAPPVLATCPASPRPALTTCPPTPSRYLRRQPVMALYLLVDLMMLSLTIVYVLQVYGWAYLQPEVFVPLTQVTHQQLTQPLNHSSPP